MLALYLCWLLVSFAITICFSIAIFSLVDVNVLWSHSARNDTVYTKIIIWIVCLLSYTLFIVAKTRSTFKHNKSATQYVQWLACTLGNILAMMALIGYAVWLQLQVIFFGYYDYRRGNYGVYITGMQYFAAIVALYFALMFVDNLNIIRQLCASCKVNAHDQNIGHYL